MNTRPHTLTPSRAHTGNFELWRDVNEEEEAEKKKKEEEEEQNAMKALENRTKQSKREMDMLDTLEELRERSALHAKVDIHTLIAKNQEVLAKQVCVCVGASGCARAGCKESLLYRSRRLRTLNLVALECPLRTHGGRLCPE